MRCSACRRSWSGLFVYLMLSRAGPLGFAGLLFTPTAMIIAQVLLATPIVIALVHRAMAGLWAEYGDLLRSDGLSKSRSIGELFLIGRAALLTAFLAAFGRAIAEVGAIIIVGGNIRGLTRTMTTAIALETSKGDLALALGLGLILIALSVIVSAATFLLAGWTAGNEKVWRLKSLDVAGVGEEQLLAADLVVGDRLLPVARDQPVDEGLPLRDLHIGMLGRIDQHHAVLVEQPLVALDQDCRARRGS